ncbi:hypothetical protein L6164_025436 [Bauhinia variegata]|uniref:Uncharacterized protein n=1 Tax=Bauhinia variegata TaxID=167791 RepID=A0ACB9M2B3_BAUVA|nr:hypothetical protein L6164_025436 [Bauhinia variegata]
MALKAFLIAFLLLTAATYPQAKAQDGTPGGLLGLINIYGTVSCPTNANMTTTNPTDQPQDSRSGRVRLRCGGRVVYAATIKENGDFSIQLDALPFVLTSLLIGCDLEVSPPPFRCNDAVQHPSTPGALVSTLHYVGTTVLAGNLLVANLVPSGFHFSRQTNQTNN